MNYKKTVEDIKDFISLEIADIERILKVKEIPHTHRISLESQIEAYETIKEIIEENEK